jgi:hypothetical protein
MVFILTRLVSGIKELIEGVESLFEEDKTRKLGDEFSREDLEKKIDFKKRIDADIVTSCSMQAHGNSPLELLLQELNSS